MPRTIFHSPEGDRVTSATGPSPPHMTNTTSPSPTPPPPPGPGAWRPALPTGRRGLGRDLPPGKPRKVALDRHQEVVRFPALAGFDEIRERDRFLDPEGTAHQAAKSRDVHRNPQQAPQVPRERPD